MPIHLLPAADHGSDNNNAENLQQQLARLERIALAAGLMLAAQWVRAHHAHSTVWVEDAKGTPEQMFTWLAKERKLAPIPCAICTHVATEIDGLYPFHRERCRCAAHIKD